MRPPFTQRRPWLAPWYWLIGLVLPVLMVATPTVAQTLTQSGFTGVLVPQYLPNGGTSRLPVVYRATVTGLTANTLYRYFNQAATNGANGTTNDIGGTNSGAGNPLFMVPAGFVYTTSTSLTTAGQYSTFTTDASGNYTGWFAFVATGNARFTAGNDVFPTIVIATDAAPATVVARRALNQSIRVLTVTNTSGANNGTYLRGASNATARNVVALYDNGTATTTPSNRPLYIAPVEGIGTTIALTPSGYATTAGSYNALIPTQLANGVRFVEQRALTNGSVVACAQDADGVWGASGVNTVNRVTATAWAPVDLTTYDTPLTSCNSSANASPTISSLTPNSVTAGSGAFTLTVDGTGFVANSVVRWNGTPRATTFVNSTQLTAAIPGTDVTSPATVPVTVYNPEPGGGLSGSSNFTVANPPSPTLSLNGTPLSNFTATTGGTSALQSFQIFGVALTGGVTVDATADFQVSTSTNAATFAASVNIAQGTAQPGPATVYVRFVPSASGTTNGTISLTSSGSNNPSFSVSGFALATEPTTKSTVTFGTVNTTTVVVNFSGGNGQKRLVVARKLSAPNFTPVDGTTYVANNAFGTGTALGSSLDNYVVYAGTANTVTVNSLEDGTLYHFSVFEYNDDNNAGAQNYLTTTPIAANSVTTDIPAPTTYTWNVASGSWSNANNWLPARTTVRVNDILVFDGSVTPTANVTVDFLPTGTANPPSTAGIRLGRLSFVNGVTATLSTDDKRQINFTSGIAGTNFNVDATSTLNVINTVTGTGIYFYLPATASGVVQGTVKMDGTVATASGATSKLIGTNTGSNQPVDGCLVFTNGSQFIAGRNFSGNAFGDQTAYQNGVVFNNGAVYRQQGGSNPFGLSAGSSVVYFASNSTYSYEQWNATPSASGRTYNGNFVIDIDLTGAPGGTTAAPSMTGASAFIINGDFRVLNAQSVSIATTPFTVKGDLVINKPTTITSASLTFGGSGTQNLSGTDTLRINSATVNVNSTVVGALGNTVQLSGTSQTLTGSGTAAFANLIDGAGTLTVNAPTLVKNSLLVTGPGTRTLAGTQALALDGATMTVNGTLNATAGEFQLTNLVQSLDGTGSASFFDLTNQTFNLTLNLPVTVKGTFLANGTTANQNLLGTGSLTLNGTTNTVTRNLIAAVPVSFGGTGSQALDGAGTATFNDLTNGAAALSLNLPVRVKRVLKLNTGNIASNGNLTLHSDAAGTALVWNASAGVVTGNTTVERYLDASLNPSFGYRHFSAPVANTTFQDLSSPSFTPQINTAYNPLPTPAIPLAQFPNVFAYDETRGGPANTNFLAGYFSPAATSDPMTPGRGYTVYFPGGDAPDFVGTLNNGNIVRTGLTRTGASTGPTQKAGWHLVGNPYPSPIDWDQLTLPSGMSKAVSVWRSSGANNAGTYVTYTNGIGPAGADLIPMGQACFVRVTSVSPAMLTFTNAARVTSYVNPAMYRAAPAQPDTRPVVALRLSAPGAPALQTDEAFVYFQTGATPAVDDDFDGEKPMHNVGAPTLVSVTNDGAELAINGLDVNDLTAGTSVPLLLDVPAAGTYVLETSRLANFEGYDVRLVDALTGTALDLHQFPTYPFSTGAAGEMRGRFSIEFGRSAVVTGTANAAATAAVTVWPNPSQGQIRVSLPSGLTASSATLVDALGRTVATPTQTTGTTELSLHHLTPGVYTLRIVTNAGAVTRRVVLQ